MHRRPRPRARSLLPLLCLLGATGCLRHRRESPPPAPEALRERLHARQARLLGLDLETRSESTLGGQRARATVLMLAARDGRLRFEVEVSLRGTVAALVADPQRYAFTDLEHARHERGPACPENIAALVRLPLSPREIAAMLLGDAAIGADGRLTGAGWDADLGAEYLDLEGVPDEGGARLAQRVYLRRHDGEYAVAQVEGAYLPPGASAPSPWAPAYRVAFDDFVRAAGLLVPDRIRFVPLVGRAREEVEIAVRARRVNPGFTAQAFVLEPPQGFAVVETGCAGPPR